MTINKALIKIYILLRQHIIIIIIIIIIIVVVVVVVVVIIPAKHRSSRNIEAPSEHHNSHTYCNKRSGPPLQWNNIEQAYQH